ncbi:MAG: DNA polymerase III subunit delta' [Pseudomonadota bacterium]
MAETEDIPRPDALPGAPHPAETDALLGQERAEAAVIEAWRAGRLHHAWLLSGTSGIGKATLAYRIAAARISFPNGATPPDTLSLASDHAVRRRIQAGSEPALSVVRRMPHEKTGKLRTQIGVDEVRNLKRGLALSAPDGGWRGVIVDAVDEMTTAAANALLKVLEEPPERTLMLLVCHAPGDVLPTIRSRCRRLDLATLEPRALSQALAGVGVTVPPGDLPALAALSGGSVGRAFQLIEGGGIQRYREIVALFGPQGIDRPGLLALAEEAGGRGRETVMPMLCDLAVLLLGRMARAGVLGSPALAAAEEAPVFAALAASPAQARLWAEAAPRIAAATRHARAVNLDPGQTILDMFLDLDTTLARAAALR